MATFKELADRLILAKGRRQTYQHLADHLSDNFISNGKPASKVLLTDEKVKIEESVIETIVQELNNAIGFLNTEITTVESSQLESKPVEVKQGESTS